jgi:hypothetical protein
MPVSQVGGPSLQICQFGSADFQMSPSPRLLTLIENLTNLFRLLLSFDCSALVKF